jgi:predicted RNase H-like HicB family nuclease
MKAEELIDATKHIPVPAAQVWWSREYQCYLATAPAVPAAIATGSTISEAAHNLDMLIKFVANQESEQ